MRVDNIVTRSGSSAQLPIKVVFVGASDAPGGVAGYINSVVDHLDPAEFDFHALCSKAKSTRWLSEQITLHEFDGRFGIFDFYRRTISLRNILKIIDPDIIHLHTARAGLLGVFSNTELMRPVVYTGHSWRFEQKEDLISRQIFYWMEKLISTRSDVVTFLTRRDLDKAVCAGLVEVRKSIAINTRIQDGWAEEVDKKMNSNGKHPACEIVVLNIGEVCERKNPMLFIEIAKRVISVRPDVRFEWLGEGHLRAQVLQRVREWGLSHAVSFPGARDKNVVQSRIGEATVLLFTSRYEGVPLVVLEAKLGGLPIVASDYPGVEAVVRYGVDGFVFGLSDPEAGAQHVLSLLNKSEKHSRLSKAGRAFATAEHSRPEVMAAEFATVYRTLVGADRCIDTGRSLCDL